MSQSSESFVLGQLQPDDPEVSLQMPGGEESEIVERFKREDQLRHERQRIPVGLQQEAKGKRLSVDEQHFKDFRRQAARYRLITADEEKHYGRLIQAGEVAKAKLGDVEASTASTVSDELAIHKANQAYETMFLANLRLISSIATGWARAHGLPIMDCVQEGMFGLATAIPKFDPELNFKFSTYATDWISSKIQRYVQNHKRLIKLPIDLQSSAFNTYLKMEADGYSTEQIMTELELDKAAMIEFQRLSILSKPISLDSPIGEMLHGDKLSLHEVIADPSTKTLYPGMVDEKELDSPMSAKISRLVDVLSEVFRPQDITILVKRSGGEPLTSTEQRRLSYLRPVLKHPSLQYAISQAADAENQWETATCNNSPHEYFKRGSPRLEVIAGCIACPLLKECETLVAQQQPRMGMWAGRGRTSPNPRKGNNGYYPDGTPINILGVSGQHAIPPVM